ncbi:MAG: septal ring lytic transglycosylase RlpA family protein [Xanthobacteraceae bacterium]
MVVRLGAALCVVAILSAYSSSSVIKSGHAVRNAIRGVAAAEPWPTQSELLERKKLNAAASGVTILGTASTYNPLRPGFRSGGTETASGETYDPAGWNAAIKIELRDWFGGVRYGKDYQPSFALVASGDKQAVVKINDVGPLEPGRIIDFTEQTMRYFDPTLELGLIYPVEVKPLLGNDWLPGPIVAAAN